jgi:hypothetical protein
MGRADDAGASPIMGETFREELRDGRRSLHYRPSGRIAWLRFLPLALIALILTPLCSLLLLLAEDNFYYFFFVPLLISLPVMGLGYLTVKFGRCRQPIVGGVVCCALMMFFYLGYWQLSFMRFLGQATNPIEEILIDQAMLKKGGRTDLLGYFIYRNRTSSIDSSPGGTPKEPDGSDEVFGYIFYGMEFIILAACGVGIGGAMGGRVFLERQGRWAKKRDFLLPIEMTAEAARVIGAGAWEELAKIPRVGAFGSQDKSRLTLSFEFLADDPQAPVFVTLQGGNLGKLPPELASIGKKGLLKHDFFKQLYVPSSEAGRIAAAFPELGIPLRN